MTVYYSPDGRLVAYPGTGTGLWIENLDGTDAHQLDGVLPQWSHDSTRLAYLNRTQDTFLVTSPSAFDHIDIRISYRHTEGVDGLGDISWSPDNRRVSYAIYAVSDDQPYSPKPSYLILDVVNSQRQVLPQDSSAPAWSPDGSHYWFHVWTDKNNNGSKDFYDGEHDLWIATANGKQHRLTENYVTETASWSPSGDHILYQKDDLTWWITSLSDFWHRKVPLEEYYSYYPAWFGSN